MKIKYLRLKNFLSIGEKEVEIDFTKLGNIVNIKGRNLDGGEGASNGCGKTSCLAGLTYALYGKLIKGLNHKEAINIKAKRGLEAEIHFDDYHVLRRRAPDRLQLWKGNEELTLGNMPATDDLIRSIIGLDYNSFVNVACFGQHNVKTFLACDAKEKRAIAENLLSLDRYHDYLKIAKEKLKSVKDKINEMVVLYQTSLHEAASAHNKQAMLLNQQQQWHEKKKQEIIILESKLRVIVDKLSNINTRTDVKDYTVAQEELVLLENEIDKRNKTRTDLHAVLEKADNALQQRRDEKQNLAIAASNTERELTILLNEVAELENQCRAAKDKTGGTCPVCYGEITEKNVSAVINLNLVKIKEKQIKWNEINKKKIEIDGRLTTMSVNIQKLIDGRKLAREKETSNLASLGSVQVRRQELSKVKQPDAATEAVLLNKDIEHIVERLSEIRDEMDRDPFIAMIEQVVKELTAVQTASKVHKENMDAFEKQLPYLDFWVSGFGDDGIRAFIIDEIIPSLNARINYWLHFLMDGRIKVEFDNQLNETIERVPIDHDPFVYNALSGGEHGRVDLAISQAFAYVTMLTTGSKHPSIVSLDEVAVNFDRIGVLALYRMICELSKERQVLVITHDPDLLDLLSGYDTIDIIMKDGITTVEN